MRLRVLAQSEQLGVPCDPDDLPELRVAEELEALPDGVLILPELLGHRLGDDHDERRPGAIHLGDVASAGHGNPERVEIAGGDLVGRGELSDGAGRRLLTLREDGPSDTAAHRQVGRERGGAHARNSAHGLQKTLLEGFAAHLVVALRAHVERQRHQILRVEPGIDPLGVHEAAQEEPGPD